MFQRSAFLHRLLRCLYSAGGGIYIKIGAVILAGGKSSRMGTDKALLSFEGESFLKRITSELKGFDEVILSINDDRNYVDFGLPIVRDIYPRCGPISGLHAALSFCKSDALFCIPCDLPLFKLSLAEYICAMADDNYDAIVPISKDGHMHPLCAVYKKSAAEIFEMQILLKKHKIIDAYEFMKVQYIPLDDEEVAEKYLFNVNTPNEYAKLKSLSNIISTSNIHCSIGAESVKI